MHGGRPPRKTAEQRAWALERLRAYLAAGGAPDRNAFVEAERARGPGVTTKVLQDVGGWAALLVEAQRISSPIRGKVVDLPLASVPEGYEVRGISSLVDESGAVDRQWIDAGRQRAAGDVHTMIPDGHRVRGVSTLVAGDGTIAAQWVKTARDPETREAALERIFRELPSHVVARDGRVVGPVAVGDTDIMAVYPLGDPHVGMLSWSPETGESFDLDLAREVMCDAMTDLVKRGPRTERALIANLGDYFHADNAQNRTARSGHALDVDGRWPKVLRTGVEILVFMIDRALEHHRHVRVVNEIGNHDDHSAVFLSVALAAYYRNEPRVEIDLSPSPYHYLRFGKCLIGITHGHNQRHDDLESIMAAERAAEWGETEHRFWYVGHIHHSTKKEKRGCVIESFRTLSPRDAWAAAMGYRSGRDMNRITLHREWGEIGRETVSASYLQSRFRSEGAA